MIRRMCIPSLLLALQVAFGLSACAEEPAAGIPKTGCPAEEDGPTRQPAVAGRFYPADPAELGAAIDGYLAAAQVPVLDGELRVLVVPHAGYVYSAGVAAHGFKLLIGRTYKTVVLIGNSHKEGYAGASVYPRGSFRTPLGDVPIDSDFARRLMAASPLIGERESAHIPEHSLEVEIPFLQKTLGAFQLVPILLGTPDRTVAEAVGQALARTADDDTLVVVSTDLSHYPSYDDAKFSDAKVLDAVVSGDVDTLERTISQIERMGIPDLSTCMCGQGAVKAGMFYAAAVGADDVRLLAYANSGDAVPSRRGVVGYGVVGFLADAASADDVPVAREEKELLSDAEKTELLRLARETVETVVRTGRIPSYTNQIPVFSKPLGAFVTLKENGELRGCIGRFEPSEPLYRVVQQMAVAAATQDHRFAPVSAAELPELDYEISVLSPLRKAQSWKEIELGRHGVQVQRGGRRGVYLPQVATETGWDLDTFMGTLCANKAGLPPDSWKDPGTDIYLFTAEVFHEP